MGPEQPKDSNNSELNISRGWRTVDEEIGALNEFFSGKSVDFYARYGNAGLSEKEEEMAGRLGVDKTLLYNSGMSAITSVLENLKLASGDVLLYSPYVYGQTKTYIENLRNLGIKCISVDPGDTAGVQEAIEQHCPRALFFETTGNDPKMPVLDTSLLYRLVEEKNKKYQPKTLSEAFQERFMRIPWIRGWVAAQAKEPGKTEEGALSALVEVFERARTRIAADKSIAGIKGLVDDLRKMGLSNSIYRAELSELIMIIQRAWDTSRQKSLTIILDNTISTESVKDMGSELKSIPKDVPVIVVESGTKFMAQDQVSLGVVYSNKSEIMQELETWRAVDGGYLPPSAAERLPDLSKEEFDKRNRNIISNAKRLAEAFAKVAGKEDILSVSHPNLPGHRNYDYVSKNMPNGSVAVFYVECAKPAVEVCHKLEQIGLAGLVEYGGSFAFEKTRLGVFDPKGNGLRIAGGNEGPEDIEKICRIIESL